MHSLIYFPHYKCSHIRPSSKLQENETIYYECVPNIPLEIAHEDFSNL